MIDFDGATQRLSFGASTALQNVGLGTCAGWATVDVAAPAGNHVVFQVSTGASAGRFRMGVLQNVGNYTMSGTSLDADAASTINNGAIWTVNVNQHIGLVNSYTAATGTGFNNGTQLVSAAYPSMTAGNTSNTNAINLRLGARADNTQFWDGKAGDWRFINDIAYTADEIRSLFVCRGTDGRWGGVGARWLCAEGAPGVAAVAVPDHSNNGLNLSPINAPVYAEYFTRRRRKVA